MSQVNRGRYMMDPVYHHAVDTMARIIIEAVEDADAMDDDSYTQRELRRQAIVTALIDAPTLLKSEP